MFSLGIVRSGFIFWLNLIDFLFYFFSKCRSLTRPQKGIQLCRKSMDLKKSKKVDKNEHLNDIQKNLWISLDRATSAIIITKFSVYMRKKSSYCDDGKFKRNKEELE